MAFATQASMSKPNETWTVKPHDELVALNESLLTVTGKIEMPFGEFERRMTIARQTNGDLVVFSPIALAEPQMQQIEAFGRLAFLVVPNEIHRLDIKPWKDRYPQMLVIAPPGSVPKVEELVKVDASAIGADGGNVMFTIVPGTGEHEAALVVKANEGHTLVINELIFNVANKPGFGGWVMKLLGVTGDEPHMPSVVRMREVKDKEALAAQLRVWSELPSLVRVIVSHGRIIEQEPRAILARIARELTS